MENRFSHLVNENLLWENRTQHIPSKVIETDPDSVIFCKNILFVMQGIENIILKIQEMQDKGELGKLDRPLDIYQIFNIATTDIFRHLQSLINFAQGIDYNNQIQVLFKLLAKISQGKAQWTDLLSLGDSLSTVGDDCTAFVEKYFQSQRPELTSQPSYQNQNTAKHQSLSHQAQYEWDLLTESSRKLTQAAKDAVSALAQVVNTHEKELVQSMVTSLNQLSINQSGFNEYSDTDAPLIKSIKALANLCLALNEICNALKGGILNKYPKLVDSLLRALDHFNHIDWPGIDDNARRLIDQTLRGTLIKFNQDLSPYLIKGAQGLAQIETTHHLRTGALSEEFRRIFRTYETTCLERGVPIINPFIINSEINTEEKPTDSSRLKETNELSLMIRQYKNLGLLMKTSIKAATANGAGLAGTYSSAITSYIPLLNTASILALVVPYLSHITDFAYAKLQAALTNGTYSAMTLIENIRRAFTHFPREELIERLQKYLSVRNLDLNTRSNIIQLQKQLITELNQQARKQLIEKIKKEKILSRQESQVLMSRIDHACKKHELETEKEARKSTARKIMTQVTSALTKTIEKWPPQFLIDLQNQIKSTNRNLADNQYKIAEKSQALIEYEKMSLEYAVNTLEEKGLNAIFNAVKASDQSPKMNLAQKRSLAILIADLKSTDRQNAIQDAHKIATSFVNNESEITNLLNALNTQALGRRGTQLCLALIAELIMAGHLSPTMASFSPTLNTELKAALIKNISRLEATQIITLREQASRSNAIADQRLNLLNLVLTGKHATYSNDQAWVNAILQHYQYLVQTGKGTEAQQIIKKLGEVARLHTVTAKAVLNNPKISNILKAIDETVYAESLINAINIDLSAQSSHHFLKKNKSLLQAIGVNNISSGQEWEIATAILQFINTKTIKGSPAEKKIREFFTAWVLLHDTILAKVRKNILENQIEAHGSIHAPYIALLVEDKTGSFWSKVKQDLIEFSENNFYLQIKAYQEQFKQFVKNILPKNSHNSPYVKSLYNKLNNITEVQCTKVRSILNDLDLSIAKRSPKNCRFTLQELTKANQEIKEAFNAVAYKDIVQLCINQLNKDIENKITRLSKKINTFQDILPMDFYNNILKEIDAYHSKMLVQLTDKFELDHAQASVQTLQKQKLAFEQDFKNMQNHWMLQVTQQALQALNSKSPKNSEFYNLIEYNIALAQAHTQNLAGKIFLNRLRQKAEYLIKQHHADTQHLDSTDHPDDITHFEQRLLQLTNIINNLVTISNRVASKGADNIHADSLISQCIEDFDQSVKLYNKALEYKNTKLAKFSYYGEISTWLYYGSLVADSVISSLCFVLNYIPPLLNRVSAISPPLVYVLDAVVTLFDIAYSAITRIHLAVMEKKTGTSLHSAESDKNFALRTTGRLSELGLKICVALAFAGILFTTPIGWALVAGATTFRWMSDMVLSTKHAWNTYQKLSKEILDINAEISSTEDLKHLAQSEGDILKFEQRLNILKSKQSELATKVNSAREKYKEKRRETAWGLVGVVGTVLVALSPFFPPLSIVGLALMGLSTLPIAIKYVGMAFQYLRGLFKNNSTTVQAESSSKQPGLAALGSYNTQDINSLVSELAPEILPHESVKSASVASKKQRGHISQRSGNCISPSTLGLLSHEKPTLALSTEQNSGNSHLPTPCSG